MDLVIDFFIDSVMIVAALAVGIVVAVGSLWVFLRVSRSNVSCVGLILLGFLLETFMLEQPYIQIGFQIYSNDIISLLVLACVAVAFVRRPLPLTELPFLLWLGFGLTILISFAAGYSAYGKAAGTELRPFFYVWVAGLYCCTTQFTQAELLRIGRWCTSTAYALIGIAIYRWVGIELGFVVRQLVFDEDGGGNSFRPIGAEPAFFIALVAVVHFMAWLRGTGSAKSGLHAAALTLFVVVLQHRSVWGALIVATVYVLLQERQYLPRRFGLLVAVVLFGGIVVGCAAAFGLMDGLIESLERSVSSVSGQQSTFTARVDGWVNLMGEWIDSSLRTWLLGFPFGHGYRRVIRGIVVEFAPHNYYINLLLRVGIVGGLFFIAATVVGVINALRVKTRSENEYLLSRGLGVILLAALVYYIPYAAYHIIGGVTGLALGQMIKSQASTAKEFNDNLKRARTTGRPANAAIVSEIKRPLQFRR